MTLYINIEDATIKNTDYRRVINTTKHDQVVLMSLEPGEDIPLETHKGSQFIRFERGTGKALIDDKEYELHDGISLNIPARIKHYIVQTGDQPLKLYAIYSPPEHEDGLIQPRQENYISNVPGDVLRLTYEYLDDADMAQACLVNKDFNRKLCNSKLWLRKIMDTYNLTQEEIDEEKGSNSYIAYYLRLKDVLSYNNIYKAIEMGDTNMVKILIRRVAYPGVGILLNPIEKGLVKIVKILLDNGNFNIKANYNYLLRRAVEHGYIDIVKLLLDAGADPDNQDALSLAREKHPEIFELLLQYQQRLDEIFPDRH